MLRSSNPVLSRQDAFTPAAPQYGQDPYGYPQSAGRGPVQTTEGRMTFDDVVTKTAITMAVLVVTAALAWYAIPNTLMFPALILNLFTILLPRMTSRVTSFLVSTKTINIFCFTLFPTSKNAKRFWNGPYLTWRQWKKCWPSAASSAH